jgi:hypothetical protein
MTTIREKHSDRPIQDVKGIPIGELVGFPGATEAQLCAATGKAWRVLRAMKSGDLTQLLNKVGFKASDPPAAATAKTALQKEIGPAVETMLANADKYSNWTKGTMPQPLAATLTKAFMPPDSDTSAGADLAGQLKKAGVKILEHKAGYLIAIRADDGWSDSDKSEGFIAVVYSVKEKRVVQEAFGSYDTGQNSGDFTPGSVRIDAFRTPERA